MPSGQVNQGRCLWPTLVTVVPNEAAATELAYRADNEVASVMSRLDPTRFRLLFGVHFTASR